jgi:phosphatidylglycerol:prolipoprotein diacylglycerol transferase
MVFYEYFPLGVYEPPISIFYIGNFSVRYYPLMYFLALLTFYFFANYLFKKIKLRFKESEYDLFIFLMFFFLIVFARMSSILIYNFPLVTSNFLYIFSLFNGGMYFYGAALGALLFGFIFAKIKKKDFFKLADVFVIIAPLIMIFVRIGNFLNGEIYGRVIPENHFLSFIGIRYATDLSNSYFLPLRYPYQIISIFRYLVIFLILYYIYFCYTTNAFHLNNNKLNNKKNKKFTKKNKKISKIPKLIRTKGFMLALFLILDGTSRFLLEFIREPRRYIGNNGFFFGFLTISQIFCILFVFFGFLCIYILKKKKIKTYY